MSVEDAADAARAPLGGTSRRGDEGGGQGSGDPSQTHPRLVEFDNLGHHRVRGLARASEPLASRLGSGKGLLCAQADQVALPLRDLDHKARDQLPVRSGSVHADVQQHERPALPVGNVQDVGEVHNVSAQSVQLGHCEALGLTRLQHSEGFDERGPVEVLGAETFVQQPVDGPASVCRFAGDASPLGFQPESTVGVLLG